MAARFVENRHIVEDTDVVVDVRSAGTQYAEWLSRRVNVSMIVVPLLALSALVPMLAPLMLVVAVGHLVAHRVSQARAAFAYPACNDEPDHAGKPGQGILLLGETESSSEFERFKEVWLSDTDLRKHLLIIGATGAGKSETLKGLFFNALCWSSGYFIADGKADNKLPTDGLTQARSFGRDDDILFLNFLLAGHTPEAVRKSRRRRSNKINPISSTDADTIIQMGANMLPKVEGDGKNWQEKALNLWRSVVRALCYLRDTEGWDLSVATIVEYLALPKCEELYMRGYEESLRRGDWSYGFAGIKAYLETGCPAFKVDKLLAKHGYGDAPAPMAGQRGAMQSAKAFEQEAQAYEQHAYRSSQLLPVLNLLDGTYGYIFRDKYPEIDMVDVALNNRILCLLIPSLEKSSQEAENLGKLGIACLRVMMGKNLGAEIEGTRRELLTSRATNAPYPFPVALDELAYYFSDGIAVMFAQARSLGMCLIAAAQDLEKLTEGTRAAEAGSMMGNQVGKLFGRIDDAGKTWEFIQKILGKVRVAMRSTFDRGLVGYKRSRDLEMREIDRVPLKNMQQQRAGEAVFNSVGQTVRIKSFAVIKDMERHQRADFFVLRFLQVAPPTDEEVMAHTIPISRVDDPVERGVRMLKVLRYESARSKRPPAPHPAIDAVRAMAESLPMSTRAPERAIALYQAARRAVLGVASAVPDEVSDGTDQVRQRHDARVQELLGDQVLAPAADRSEQAQALLDDDVGLDPLAFLESPFERKPADVLFGDVARTEASLKPPASSASPAPAAAAASSAAGAIQERADLVDGAGSGASPLDAFIAGGQSLSLSRLPVGAAQPARDTVPEGLAGESRHAAEAATLNALVGMGPEPGGGSGWVMQAVGQASMTLRERADQGLLVVGFTPDATRQVEQLEEALGSQEPAAAAKRLEVVVASKVTPDLKTDAPLDDDAINDFFKNLPV